MWQMKANKNTLTTHWIFKACLPYAVALKLVGHAVGSEVKEMADK